jgi:hypothetical protein
MRAPAVPAANINIAGISKLGRLLQIEQRLIGSCSYQDHNHKLETGFYPRTRLNRRCTQKSGMPPKKLSN